MKRIVRETCGEDARVTSDMHPKWGRALPKNRISKDQVPYNLVEGDARMRTQTPSVSELLEQMAIPENPSVHFRLLQGPTMVIH